MSLVVAARGNAGSTGPGGTALTESMISAECCRLWSLFLKCITTFQFTGTVNVNPPSLNPLKFKELFWSVSPATSSRVAVLLALSTVSLVQSICGDGFAVGLCAVPVPTESSASPAMSEQSLVMCSRYLGSPLDTIARLPATGRYTRCDPARAHRSDLVRR